MKLCRKEDSTIRDETESWERMKTSTYVLLTLDLSLSIHVQVLGGEGRRKIPDTPKTFLTRYFPNTVNHGTTAAATKADASCKQDCKEGAQCSGTINGLQVLPRSGG